MFRKIFYPMFCISIISFFTNMYADDTNVNGTVTDNAGNFVPDAIVTVRIGYGISADSSTGLTDANGAYSIDIVVGGGTGGMGGFVTISVVASGFNDATQFTVVQNANDGNPDTVTSDFQLVPSGGPNPTDGDTLIVKGTVSEPGGTFIEGAMVSVSINGTEQASGTTDNAGTYELIIQNSMTGVIVGISVDATGFQNDQVTAQVQNPADGTPDTVSEDFVLEPVVLNTIVVSGIVVNAADDSPLADADITLNTSGGGGGEILGTGVSEATGIFSIEIQTEQNVNRVRWLAELAGFQSESGNEQVPGNDTLIIDTIRLTAFTTQDSVVYSVTGTISDENGDGLGGAEVVVTIEQAGTVIYTETVTTSGQFRSGRYSIETQQPYAAEDIIVTITVTANDYQEGTESVTIPSSTSDIVLDLQLFPVGVVVLPGKVLNWSEQSEQVEIYTVNGSLIGKYDSADLKIRNINFLLGNLSQQAVFIKIKSKNGYTWGRYLSIKR